MPVDVKTFPTSVFGASAASWTSSSQLSSTSGPRAFGEDSAFVSQCGSGKSSEVSTTADSWKRHQEYYFDDGNVVILVEGILFRLHRSILERHSAVFREMWSVPPPHGTTEGMRDDNPIILAGISGVAFIRLLWVLYPSALGSCKATTADEWISILDQADRWQIDSLRFWAVAQLKTLAVDPVLRIVLWVRYNLDPNDLVPSYTLIITRPQSLSLEEAQHLGMELVVKVASARDRVRAEGLALQGNHFWNGVNYAAVHPNRDAQIAAIVRDTFGVPTGKFWL